MTTAHILIVEDEPDLAQLLQDYLQASHYQTSVISDGNLVEPWVTQHTCDLILLDLMLPNKGGLDICRDIRKTSDTPIIMMTAKVEEIDRLLGLELGADDYICKPYSPREVIARVKAVLKRTQASHALATSDLSNTSYVNTEKNIKTKELGPLLTLNQNSNTAIVNQTHIELTIIEYKILALLYDQPGRIFSRQYILDNIYTDYRIVSDRTVDSHIKKLRKKLHNAHPECDVIRSVYGAGYKYDVQ